MTCLAGDLSAAPLILGTASASHHRGNSVGGGSAVPALGAGADHVQAVVAAYETVDLGHVAQVPRHRLLERRGRREVDDPPAARAQQMVVVLGDVFSQFEAPVLVVGRDPPHHTRLLEVDQVAVGGAAGQARCSLGDVLDGHRVPGTGQQLDDHPSPVRVTLGDLPQPLFGHAVQRFVHYRHPKVRCHRAQRRPETYQTAARLPTKKPIGQFDQNEAAIDSHTVRSANAEDRAIAPTGRLVR